jgi:hypothetical protein
MSNVEDWERRHAQPLGCSILTAIGCFAGAAFFIGYPVSQWLRGHQLEMPALPLLAMGGFFLFGGVAYVWRLVKGKPIPTEGRGHEPPPVIEIYDFLPKDRDVNKRGSDGPDPSV